MRIISRFKDYYDHAVADTDPSLVWARTVEEPQQIQRVNTSRQNSSASIDQWKDWPQAHLWLTLHNRLSQAAYACEFVSSNYAPPRDLRIQPAVLLLAGEPHFALLLSTFRYNNNQPPFEPVQWCWSTQAVQQTFFSWYPKLDPKSLRTKNLDAFFDTKTAPSFEQLQAALLERKTPTPLVLLKADSPEWATLTVNPSLLEIQFTTQKSAPQTYQAIELYLGLHKTAAERFLPAVDNDQKISQAGFDLRTSFRKPPASS